MRGKTVAVETVIRSDLSGESGAQRIKFSIEAEVWEADLTDAELEKLREAVQPFAAVARSLGPVSSAEDRDEIRAWARRNGFGIGRRGRIPQHIVEAFEKQKN